MPSGTDRRYHHTNITCPSFDEIGANVQGLFHEDIRAITLTLFLLWSVTNLVYYGTIFGIEVRTEKSL